MVTQEQLISWGIQFGIALAVIILGNIVSKFLVSMVGKAMEKKQVDPVIVGFVSRILYVILILGVLIAAISQLGVDTTSLVAVLGAAGLAIGLALKDSLSNFASGVLIVALRPFKAGDFVEAGGCMGSVQEIQLFSTTLKTPDNKVVIVPNAAVTGNAITNFSTQKTRRVDLVICVSYDADIKQAKELLVSILEADERILKDPAYTVAVSELADSSVNFIVRPWVNSADYWGVYFDLHETIKIKLDEAEIGIPYPQMDVHVHQ